MRPSELLDVESPFAAYCLDNACAAFGQALDGELKSIEGKTKKEIAMKTNRLMAKWLDMPMRFRDPAKSGHAPSPVAISGEA